MIKKTKSKKIQLVNRAAMFRLALFAIFLSIIIFTGWFIMIRMPGKSYRGQLPPLTPSEIILQNNLKQTVEKLSQEIGEHNFIFYKNLVTAADFLDDSLVKYGYKVQRQGYEISGKKYYNLEVEIPGTDKANEIVIIGGHYDSVTASPGANDNSSGAAGVLELARIFAGKNISRTLRFVEFVNEEPPFFWTPDMGSMVYAKRCQARGEKIMAMLSLETIGYYSDIPGSQKYPFPLDLIYPGTGDFIAFVGNIDSGNLVRNVISLFRKYAQFPSEGAALPGKIPGVGWSDHWSFWQYNYPALMVTDTAPFRYPYYHTEEDTPDKINYDRMARVVAGLEKVISDLVGIK